MMAFMRWPKMKIKCSNLEKKKGKTKMGSRQRYVNRVIFVLPIKIP